MNREDIEKAIEICSGWEKGYPGYRTVKILVQVAKEYIALEEWVENCPYVMPLTVVREKMHAPLNPAPKSDLERVREYVRANGGCVPNPFMCGLLDLVKQLEAEKEQT